MELYEVLKTRRSIRKFTQEKISDELLAKLVDVARYAPAAANVQPLKYAVVRGEMTKDIFPLTRWAKLLGERGTPQPGEEPTAYIFVMTDTKNSYNKEADASLAIENIVLAAWYEGIGSCILGSIDKPKIARLINMPQGYEINYAIALGYPAQESLAEEEQNGVAYYMDDEGVVHVPKRKLCDVMYFADEQ
ncbi:MAG: nitroreductase family protein [Clostridia bacterium]|nr:nitroreductase family protein [Clostridia bacterium]